MPPDPWVLRSNPQVRIRGDYVRCLHCLAFRLPHATDPSIFLTMSSMHLILL
ncbi:unnamed protein product [Penicillium salamii]|nr:unnamed protein product [Penicillium salamii]